MATKKVKETVDTVKNEAKEAAKKISKKAEPAVEAAKKTVKTVSEKAEPAVKKAKTAAKNVSDKTKTAAKAVSDKTKTAAKTASKKVASALTPEVFVEFGGAKYECSTVADRCKEDYKAKHPGERIRSCRVYIKPEDGMAYYVINELADKISL